MTRDTALLSFGSETDNCVFLMHQSRTESAVYVILQEHASPLAPAEVLHKLQYITSEVNLRNYRKQIVVSAVLCNRKGQEAQFRDVYHALDRGESKVRNNLPVEDFQIWFNTHHESVVCRWQQREVLAEVMQTHYPKVVQGLSSEEIFFKVLTRNPHSNPDP